LKDNNGKPLNNGLQYLLKNDQGGPSNNLSKESLAAMDINKVFSIRSNSAANAKKAVLEKQPLDIFNIAKTIPVDAVGAISKARQQQGRKSFDQKILDETILSNPNL
jgi:hypothetical protein